MSVNQIATHLDTFFDKIYDVEVDPEASVELQSIIYLSDDSSIKLILMLDRAIKQYESSAIAQRKLKDGFKCNTVSLVTNAMGQYTKKFLGRGGVLEPF